MSIEDLNRKLQGRFFTYTNNTINICGDNYITSEISDLTKRMYDKILNNGNILYSNIIRSNYNNGKRLTCITDVKYENGLLYIMYDTYQSYFTNNFGEDLIDIIQKSLYIVSTSKRKINKFNQDVINRGCDYIEVEFVYDSTIFFGDCKTQLLLPKLKCHIKKVEEGKCMILNRFQINI